MDNTGSPDLYIPNYMSFHNDNIFLGSYQGIRFRLAPDLKAEPETIHAEYWTGPFCYEYSTVEALRDFPLTDAGIADMTEWLRSVAAVSAAASEDADG